MESKLNLSYLSYGSSTVKVVPNRGVPLPPTFDFADPIACARKVMAIMCNASGGHILKDCKLHYNSKTGDANITANGAHVYYTTGVKLFDFDNIPTDPWEKASWERTVREMVEQYKRDSVTVKLGNVTTDQYGDGWKHAVWS